MTNRSNTFRDKECTEDQICTEEHHQQSLSVTVSLACHTTPHSRKLS